MAASWWSLVLEFCLVFGDGGVSPTGYVSASARNAAALPYAPRQGDLIFYDDRSRLWTLLFTIAGTGPPLHMGIVVKKADGAWAILEAGPDDTLWVELPGLVERLHQFQRDYQGRVTIRRCKKTLDPQQAKAMSQFAQAQKGKRYALGRLLLQGTPLRVRGPLEPFLAATHLDRDAWICSELAVAAGTAADLFDPALVPANVVYPRDLIDDRCYDLSAGWEAAVEWRPAGRRQ